MTERAQLPGCTHAETLVPACLSVTWSVVLDIVAKTWGERFVVVEEPSLLVHDVSDCQDEGNAAHGGVPAWLTWRLEAPLPGWCRIRLALAEAGDGPPADLDAVLTLVIQAVLQVPAVDA